MIKLAIFGFGYWGPNLVRVFSSNNQCKVKYIVDLQKERRMFAKEMYPDISVIDSIDKVLSDSQIDGVVIALPVSEHYRIVLESLKSGKHVLVEKPLTNTLDRAQRLIDYAFSYKRVLMVDHTYLYTGAVRKIKEIISSDEIGNVQYYDSVRANLGLFRNDINVIWDLAPHDISILTYLINEMPTRVIATGLSHTSNGIEDVAYLSLLFQSNKIAHFNVSWVSPVKVRQTVIGGTKKMIIYDDLSQNERVKVYDTCCKLSFNKEINNKEVEYRSNGYFSPEIDHREALKNVADEFIDAIINGIIPISDSNMALSVVRVLEAADKSIKNLGKEILV